MKLSPPIIATVVLGLLGFVAMFALLNRGDGGASKERRSTKRILIAKQSLAAGSRLAASHVDVRGLPAEYASTLHVEESQLAAVLGRSLRVAVREGDPILLPALDVKGSSASREIESQLRAPDRLAITLELAEAASLAGLVEPGQRVDVLGTFKIKKEGKSDEEVYTYLLLQNRAVLAVDVRSMSRYAGDPKEVTKHVVTLAVTAEEAQRIAFLQASGTSHLALRQAGDDRIETLPRLEISTLTRAKP